MANVTLYFKSKEYIVPHVETEKSSIKEKYTSKLLLPKARTIVLCV